ncbi:hypothetical protein ACFYWU_34605 [Streptomyces chrestomyceticus]|uniref:hypothetical protein n=1 Tax=Streptomyces chrestomyceticus TaxID=68185 RepID=UPI0036BB1AF4
MRIKGRLGALAAAGALVGSIITVGAASPAQADSDPRCVGTATPPSGTMCVHIHNLTKDTWYWFGPWTVCRLVQIPLHDELTWVESNQVGNVHSTYYDNDGGIIGTTPAKYNNRPPGYQTKIIAAIRVC